MHELKEWDIKLWCRRILLVFMDAVCVMAAYLATLAFRFGGIIPEDYWQTFLGSIIYIVLIYIFNISIIFFIIDISIFKQKFFCFNIFIW